MAGLGQESGGAARYLQPAADRDEEIAGGCPRSRLEA
jgi:hypothetical protein